MTSPGALTRGPGDQSPDKGTKGTITEEEHGPLVRLSDAGPLVSFPRLGGPLVRVVACGPLVRSTGGRLTFEPSHVSAIAGLFGDRGSGRFACPLPGHEGAASIVEQDGAWWLRCCAGRLRSLAEVQAARAYGSDGRRSNIELATWARRLAFDVGALEPVDVPLPEAPGPVSGSAALLAEGFRLLLGLRWWDGEVRPAAYAARFAGAWTGVSHDTAARGVRALIAAGVLAEAGRAGTGGRSVALYLPGRAVRSAPPPRTLDDWVLRDDPAADGLTLTHRSPPMRSRRGETMVVEAAA